jgi:DNA-directed RNA polymerase specialized sigma24 family protein
MMTGSRLIDLHADYIAGAVSLDDLLAAVRSYALAVTRDEDVAQTVAMHIFLHLDDYNPTRGTFPGWVRVLAQTIRKRRRSAERLVPVEENLLADLAEWIREDEAPTSDRLYDLLDNGPGRELLETALRNDVSLTAAGQMLGLTPNQTRYKIGCIKSYARNCKTGLFG